MIFSFAISAADISIAKDIFSILFSLVGLLGILFGYKQLKLSQEANAETALSTRARFILDLNQWFLVGSDEKAFLYRLDYSQDEKAFKFDPEKFPHSKDEIHLDNLLLKLTYIGSLLKNNVLSVDDLQWAKAKTAMVMENTEVQAYLKWIKSPSQIPNHSSFQNAVHLYISMFPQSKNHRDNLIEYVR